MWQIKSKSPINSLAISADFKAKDMKSAINLVNNQFGENAVILSTRKNNGVVEVEASDSDDAIHKHKEKLKKTIDSKNFIAVPAESVKNQRYVRVNLLKMSHELILANFKREAYILKPTSDEYQVFIEDINNLNEFEYMLDFHMPSYLLVFPSKTQLNILNAEKTLVQKSGYFGRSSKPNQRDLNLIFELADFAVNSAINGISGVVGRDEDNLNKLNCINFNRISGGKPFDINQEWYIKMMQEIKQIEK